MGAIRVAASMRDVHCVLHAPQGDSYADLLFTMIARSAKRPPVTYTSFQARDLGGDTAELVKKTLRETVERFRPRRCWPARPAPPSCCRISPAPWPRAWASTSRWCRWSCRPTPARRTGAPARPSSDLVRALLRGRQPPSASRARPWPRPPRPRRQPARSHRARLPLPRRHHRGDQAARQRRRRCQRGRPGRRRPEDLLRIPEADFNVCLYPEIAYDTCAWLERMFKQPTG
jgi:light-independent protochlorophyllide reductase subunit B